MTIRNTLIKCGLIKPHNYNHIFIALMGDILMGDKPLVHKTPAWIIPEIIRKLRAAIWEEYIDNESENVPDNEEDNKE